MVQLFIDGGGFMWPILFIFIIGFVFRNQLRKSVPNLLDGFKKFKKENAEAKNAKLLLHTCFNETWDIQALAKEKGIDKDDCRGQFH